MDTADKDNLFRFQAVDRRLGTVETLKTVVSELHEAGIRVVLDGVFNHTGRGHSAFQQCVAEGQSR